MGYAFWRKFRPFTRQPCLDHRRSSRRACTCRSLDSPEWSEQLFAFILSPPADPGACRCQALSRNLVLLAYGALLAVCSILTPMLALGAPVDDCRVGSYVLVDGSELDIAHSEGDTLRWRRFDGTTGALHPQGDGTWIGTRGWTKAEDGVVVSFIGCDVIRFAGVSGTRRQFDVRDVVFESHSTALAGRLVMPPGGGKVAVVVLLHGSEHDSALEDYSLQRMLPAQGIRPSFMTNAALAPLGGPTRRIFRCWPTMPSQP